MKTHPGIEAVRMLAHMGYRFMVNGETIKAKYDGPGKPDPDAVRPLFEVVRVNKPEVVNFLSCYSLDGKINDDESADRKPISTCPKCQREIFIISCLDKKFCFRCLFNEIGEIGSVSTGFTELDLAIEAAVERSAILEFDGGLDRKQADETAWVLHIKPAIEDLRRRGLIAIERGTPQGGDNQRWSGT